MPIIQVTLVEGRPREQVKHFIKALAETAKQHLNAPESTIRVMVHDVAPDYFAVGTTLKSEMASAKEGV
jgi:4-oxalocrotonate tautomerase family enzyme